MIHVKITVAGRQVTIKANNFQDLKGDLARTLIRHIYKKELAAANNKTGAVLNTSVLLEISEKTVWKALEDGRKE